MALPIAARQAWERLFDRYISETMMREALRVIGLIKRSGAAVITQDETWLQHQANLTNVLGPIFERIARQGVQSVSQAWRGPEVNWMLINRDAESYARRYTFDLVGGITQTTRKMLQDVQGSWIQSGEKLDVLIDQISNLKDGEGRSIFGPVRSEMIAVTETTNVYAQANALAWQAAGYTPVMYKPAAHPRCILPGNVVAVPGLLAAAKSFYSGRVIEITTNSGRSLTVTQNHPILTGKGWVAAKFIHEGCDVFEHRSPERITSSINPDYQHRPSVIEQVFSSLKVASSVLSARVPTSTKDFYGDGGNVQGDVEVVYPNSFLLYDFETLSSEPIRQFVFDRGSHLSSFSLTGGSVFEQFGSGWGSASRGGVGGIEHRAALGGSTFFPTDQHGLSYPTWLDLGFQESASEGSSVDTQLAREFVLRFSGDISRQKVAQVRDFDFSGHVYDLQSDLYGLYICNGIIVKNCRCWIKPATLPDGSKVIIWQTARDEVVCKQPIQTPWGIYNGCRKLHTVVLSEGPYAGMELRVAREVATRNAQGK